MKNLERPYHFLLANRYSHEFFSKLNVGIFIKSRLRRVASHIAFEWYFDNRSRATKNL